MAEELVEGLKVLMTVKELSSHCLTRASHHAQRVEEKSALIPELTNMLDRLMKGEPLPEGKGYSWLNETTGGALVSSGGLNYKLNPKDVLDKFQADIREHRRASASFAFFATHLYNSGYVLTEDDLVRLEIIPSARRIM